MDRGGDGGRPRARRPVPRLRRGGPRARRLPLARQGGGSAAGGIEFALHATSAEARLLADPPSNPIVVVLQDPASGPVPEEYGTVTVPGIRIVAAAREGAAWRSWPGANGEAALFTWPTWEVPRSRERVRPVYAAMRDVFRTLDPPVTH